MPASPTISVLTSTDTSITLEWGSPDGSSVELEGKSPTDVKYHVIATLGSGGGSCTLYGLLPNREYALRLRSEIDAAAVYTDASIRTQETVVVSSGDMTLPAPVLNGQPLHMAIHRQSPAPVTICTGSGQNGDKGRLTDIATVLGLAAMN